eukprot:TRINITY_DN5737_c0_g1_i1.p1 TRINITY_DN5737_c0_g1~~TRINITY_DN5737_c0_g1_i1.p1  ORF type:complete len:338 (+),score=58.97 TRINITY_DN5737_c0_g1_i1:139-1014(+)
MARETAIACCKVYISESRNAQAVEKIERACKGLLINVFKDIHYNRVGFTLASSVSSPRLQEAAFQMATTALETIDFQSHSGTHPRLGVVDHISYFPLGTASLHQVAGLARSLAREIGTGIGVPTYLYGAADSENRSLDFIRRSLGYFKANSEGKWVGLMNDNLSLVPDYGPSEISSRTGVVVVGASPWVANYNVPINCSDLRVGRMIAKQVSGRGGGLPGVQAMALLHGDKAMEIACNLLDSKNVGPERVQEEVESLAQKQGLTVGKGYLTDCSEDRVLKLAYQRMKQTED